MGLGDDSEMSNLPPRNPGLGHTPGPIASLNEAWLQTLDRCVTVGALTEVILPPQW
jgi:hypothetical protein